MLCHVNIPLNRTATQNDRNFHEAEGRVCGKVARSLKLDLEAPPPPRLRHLIKADKSISSQFASRLTHNLAQHGSRWIATPISASWSCRRWCSTHSGSSSCRDTTTGQYKERDARDDAYIAQPTDGECYHSIGPFLHSRSLLPSPTRPTTSHWYSPRNSLRCR